MDLRLPRFEQLLEGRPQLGWHLFTHQQGLKQGMGRALESRDSTFSNRARARAAASSAFRKAAGSITDGLTDDTASPAGLSSGIDSGLGAAGGAV